MPEGPRIILLKEQASRFIGQQVCGAGGNSVHISRQQLIGQTLTGILTFGKELLLCFPDFTIRIHLLLFGKYAIDGELNRELRLGLQFETGEINFYACDCRLLSAPPHQVYDWRQDVMHPSFDREMALNKLLFKPQRLITDAVLDQEILAGVSNGIKNEALFRQRVHPESLTGFIPPDRLRHLINACVELSHAYLEWLRTGTGENHWRVYRRKMCPRDQVPLRLEKLGRPARSCYFCEKCQHWYHPDNPSAPE